MLKIFLFISTVPMAFADLLGEAKVGDNILKYYNGHLDQTIFSTAVVSCMQKGGELVMPKNAYLNDAVADVAQGGIVWIGGGDLFAADNYEWNDGERIEWSNWDSGEPNDNNGEKNCIQTSYTDRRKWSDHDCCTDAGYVCQIPDAVSAPFEYSEFTAYADSTDRRSYSEAKQFCERRRSRLVLLRNGDDVTFLQSMLIDDGITQFWIDNGQEESPCPSVSSSVFSTDDCQEPMAFLCEEVAPHGLSVSEEQLTVEPGMHLNVDCSASGVPVPEVAWYRDGVYVPNQRHGIGSSTLVVHGVSADDVGMYVCEAVNEVGGKLRSMKGYSFLETVPNQE